MIYIVGMVIAFAVGIYAGLGYPGLPDRRGRGSGGARRRRRSDPSSWMRPRRR